MSPLCLSNREMLDRISEYAFGLVYIDLPGSDEENEVKALLNAGFRRFLRGGYADELQVNSVHRWSFLDVLGPLNLVLAQSATTYDLPTDFGGIIEPPAYAYTGDQQPSLARVSPERVREEWRDDNTEAQPKYYAIEPKAFNESDGQEWQLLVAPVPDASYTIKYRYSVILAELDDSAVNYPPGGAIFCDVIVQAGLAAAEKKRGDVAGHHEQLYQMMLREAIARDATTGDETEVEQLTDADAGM